MAIDLPEATSLSGIEAAFEDGDGRTQKFEIVLLGESEVRTTAMNASKTVRAFILHRRHAGFTLLSPPVLYSEHPLRSMFLRSSVRCR